MDSLQIYLIVVIVFWAITIGIAAQIGGHKEAAVGGFFMGLLFGPLGILITAVALDWRQKCPTCLERVNTGAQQCPTCKTDLRWTETAPGRLGSEFSQ